MTASAARPRARPAIEGEFLARAARLCIPFTLQLNLTHRCNLRCIHCFRVEEARPELETAEAFHVLDQAAAAGTFNLVLTGGEVLCRADLPEVLRRALDLRFAVRLFTNGTLIDDEKADVFAASSIQRVEVSVYSLEDAVHDAITGVPGSLAWTMAGIERLRRRGVRVGLKCVVMKPNRESLDGVRRFAEAIGASCAFDLVVSVRNDGDQDPLAWRIGFDDLIHVFRTPVLEELSGDPVDDGLRGGAGDADAPPCGAGVNTCSISPYGDVTPCLALPLVAGNVREEGFEEIWKGSSVMARMRSLRVRDIRECGTCVDLGTCGRCPGSAFLEDGDVAGPSRAACQVAAARRAAAEREVRV